MEQNIIYAVIVGVSAGLAVGASSGNARLGIGVGIAAAIAIARLWIIQDRRRDTEQPRS